MSNSNKDPLLLKLDEEEVAESGNEVTPVTPEKTPQGFEEFDLDDIEVIESKVFA
ncbi:hypothetical protein GCM10027514_14310 [Azotobacter armeniacus]